MTRLIEETRGRWHALLPAIGVRSEFLTGRNGPCPFCGGKDRWRFLDTDGKGTWICNQCGSGNGFDIVKRALKVATDDAFELIRNLLRTASPANLPKPKNHEALRLECRRMWNHAAPLGDDEAAAYLRSRAIDLPTWPKALRCAPHVMLAKIITAKDEAINLHRTFLPRGPKKYMPGVVPAGSAVRLMPQVGILGIAEGIETALSAYLLFGVPCWAACDAGHVASFTPPDTVRAVCFYADNDTNCAGQSAAYAAAQRLSTKGLSVSVKIPDDADTDWNDVLQRRGTP